MSFGEHVQVEQDLLGGIQRATLPGMDRVLVAFPVARVVVEATMLVRNGRIVLARSAADLLEEPLLQRPRVGGHRLRVGVLGFEIRDHVRMPAFPHPVIGIDTRVTVGHELVRLDLGLRWRGFLCCTVLEESHERSGENRQPDRRPHSSPSSVWGGRPHRPKATLPG